MAYDFVRSSSQYLSNASAVLTSEPITLACWFNIDDDTVDHGLISLTDDDAGSLDSFTLRATATNAVEALKFVAGVASTAARTTSLWSANTWHHGAATYTNSNTWKAYLDGVTNSPGTTSIGTPSGLNNTFIGVTRTGGTNFTDGRIAEVAIWAAVLTDAEVAAHAKGYAANLIRPGSLVFYEPLVRDLVDRKGGLVLTNNNTATVAVHPRVYYPKRRYVMHTPSATPGTEALSGQVSSGAQGIPAPSITIAL